MLSKHYLSSINAVKRVARLKTCTVSKRHESSTSSEYTATPNYPTILSLKTQDVEKREIETKAEKLKQVHTVEEKLLAINVPRYWGWMSVIVNEGDVPYDFLPFAQHITRTRMVEVDALPVPLPNAKFQEIIKKVKDQLEKVITFELCCKNHKFYMGESAEDLTESSINEALGKALIEQINRCILSNLSPHAPHLVDLLVDYEPRLEAFWTVGGFYPSSDEKKHNKYYNDFWGRSNDRLDDPMDRWIQYFGSPVLQLRSRFPLEPISEFPGPTISETNPKPAEKEETVKSANPVQDQKPVPKLEGEPAVQEPLTHTFEIPSHKYDPRITYGLEFRRQYGLTVPGFFPNDRHEYGFLSYHKRNHMLGRPPNFGDEHDEALHAQAILASYSWLFGQACYQGFSTFNNPTYPLTAQTVLTDGRLWSFYAYQLNTTTLYDDHIDTNPHQNVCYGVKTTELYHSIEDGKIKGWNDKALETLFSFYFNECRIREGVNMKPYLHPEESLIEHIEDEEKRLWLQKMTRYMYPRRHKYERTPTIYEWEQIYRIDNQVRPMDARHKFYQKGLDPLNEDRWSHQQGSYIPKKLRKPDKRRQKHETTFYPDVL